jgi:hypothetical protein
VLSLLVVVGVGLGPLLVSSGGTPAAAATLSKPKVPSSGAYFGGWTQPRGAETRQDAVAHFESQIGRKLAFDHQYYRWNDTLPTVQETWDVAGGRIPFVSWRAQRKDDTMVKWSSIAGGAQDAWIAAQADRIRDFGHPMFMVFNHEPYQQSTTGWGTPAEFAAAWRHVVDIFRAHGATNVAWVLVLTAWDYKVTGRAQSFYPGDTYVDWLAADPYNFFTRDGVWRELSLVADGFATWGADKKKPKMIAEWGTEEDPATPGRKAQWFNNARAWLKTQPAIKAVSYYNSNVAYPWWIDTTTSSLTAYKTLATDTWFTPTFADVIGAAPPSPGPVLHPEVGAGYWLVAADGRIYPFGEAQHHGDPAGTLGTAAAVDVEPTPASGGYWVVDDLGRVYAYGDARHLGNAPPGLAPGERVTSLSRTRSGAGYWVFTSRGRVFSFGDAPFLGDMSGTRLNGLVVDSVVGPSGAGYYLVAADGGIFAFGDARFAGSMGGRPLNAPVRSLVPDADGNGYWLVAADGGVFAFDAPFRGSMGGTPLNRPVRGMVRFGNGYLMVGDDGGIFNFSDRPFEGSLGGQPPAHPVVAVAALG